MLYYIDMKPIDSSGGFQASAWVQRITTRQITAADELAFADLPESQKIIIAQELTKPDSVEQNAPNTEALPATDIPMQLMILLQASNPALLRIMSELATFSDVIKKQLPSENAELL